MSEARFVVSSSAGRNESISPLKYKHTDYEQEKIVPELGEFIIENKTSYQGHEDDLNRIFTSIKLACKLVNREIRKMGLVDVQTIKSDHISSVAKKKSIYSTSNTDPLELFSHVKFVQALLKRQVVCGISSTKEEKIIKGNPHKNYCISLDPLDGGRNVHVNVSTGTVFGVWKRLSPLGGDATEEDFLQSPKNLVAAGYVIYGPCTQLVISTGNGLSCFTLDPSVGTFFLSHPSLQFPTKNKGDYSVNEGYYQSLPQGTKKFINWCRQEDKATSRPLSCRYIGSLVSDLHRNFFHGGIFLYTQNQHWPKGKLRLIHHCFPIAFLVEQAGGCATNGEKRILDISPTSLYELSALVAGQKYFVELVSSFYNN